MAWLALPNIVGVSVGPQLSSGKPTGETAVIFDVVAKFPATAEIVRAGGRPIPATIAIDGVQLPTDVVEAWPEAHDQPSDPLCGGISIGCAVETGTLGAIVRHCATGAAVALSNWHVLVDNRGDMVTQPGPMDGGTAPQQAIGATMARVLDPATDAAIAPIGPRHADRMIAGLNVAVEAVTAPVDGMRVIKSGRTTGITSGTIVMPEKIVGFPIAILPTRHRMMVFTIRRDACSDTARPLSAGGDSGSCWMLIGPDGNASTTMVGLHVGGDGPDVAYAGDATRVFDALGIEPMPVPLLGAAPPAFPAALTASLAPGKPNGVLARHGLWLRGGPGLDFPKLELLAPGRTVHVVGTNDAWRMIDLCGDGQIDGFAYGAFLAPLD